MTARAAHSRVGAHPRRARRQARASREATPTLNATSTNETPAMPSTLASCSTGSVASCESASMPAGKNGNTTVRRDSQHVQSAAHQMTSHAPRRAGRAHSARPSTTPCAIANRASGGAVMATVRARGIPKYADVERANHGSRPASESTSVNSTPTPIAARRDAPSRATKKGTSAIHAIKPSGRGESAITVSAPASAAPASRPTTPLTRRPERRR